MYNLSLSFLSDNVPFPNVSLIIITQYFLNEFQAYGRSLVPAPESLKMFWESLVSVDERDSSRQIFSPSKSLSCRRSNGKSHDDSHSVETVTLHRGIPLSLRIPLLKRLWIILNREQCHWWNPGHCCDWLSCKRPRPALWRRLRRISSACTCVRSQGMLSSHSLNIQRRSMQMLMGPEGEGPVSLSDWPEVSLLSHRRGSEGGGGSRRGLLSSGVY